MYALFNAMLASYVVIIYASKDDVVVPNQSVVQQMLLTLNQHQSKVLEEDGVQINDTGG